MILFSTKAGDGRPLYTRDLLRACCLPEGEKLLFGYGADWMPTGLTAKGAEGMIVFAEVKDAADPTRAQSFLAYHAIRKVHVDDEYERIGGGKTFRLTLGRFFRYGSASQPLEADLQQWYERCADAPHAPKPRRFVHVADLWDKQDLFPDTKPDGLIAYMARRNGLRDRYFFHLDSDESPGDLPDAFREAEGVAERRWFRLKAGETYKLSLRIYAGREAKFRPPELQISSSVCSVSGPFTEQYETGYRARFLLTCRRSFDRESGMLWVRIPPENGQNSQIVSPEIQEHVELRPPLLLVVFILALFVFGSLPSVADMPQWLRIVTGLGPALGAFLLMRRLKL